MIGRVDRPGDGGGHATRCQGLRDRLPVGKSARWRSMKRFVSLVSVLFMSFSVHAQQDALRPFVPPPAEIKLGTVLTGQLLVGRTDAWPGAPDFFCRQSTTASNVVHPLADGSPKCYARSMVLGDIGD